MAEVVLKPAPQSFPIGTTVTVYTNSTATTPPRGGILTGTPAGASVTSAAVASDGSLTFTGLTAEVGYVGYALVGGVDRYLYFSTEGPGAGVGAWSIGSLAKCTNGVVGSEPAAFRLEQGGNTVRARGALKTTALVNSLEAFATVPAGMRPAAGKFITLPAVYTGSTADEEVVPILLRFAPTGEVQVAGATAGALVVPSGKIIKLDGLTWSLT